MKKYIHLIFALISIGANAQVGIGTTTPQKTLHVNGSLQVTNEINVGGNATTAGSAGIAGQVLVSKGTGTAPEWQNISIPPTTALSTGTVIAVNGVMMIAQEVTALMSADAVLTGQSTGNPRVITNLTTEIIDNENTFNSTATTNSFKVSADGVYQIIMNMQLDLTTRGSSPSIGVWNDTDVVWVSRVSDMFGPVGTIGSAVVGKQTYTLITSATLLASKTYSFRASNTADFTIKALSGGTTGTGPVSFVSIKRLN